MHTQRCVRLHPLSFLVEGEDVVVGRTDVDSYAVFPADGAALIGRLAEGLGRDAAADWYRRTYGEPVDLDDFLDTLGQLGFLADPGGAEPGASEPGASEPGVSEPGVSEPEASAGGTSAPGEPVRGRVPPLQRVGRAVFSPAAWLGYVTLVLAALAAWVAEPDLLPHPDHLFFSEYLLVIELTLVFGQIPLILLHEVFHLLAARRLGVRARIRLGQRLYFVVFETVMDGLVMVPRAKRYLPILAGMLADLLVVCGLTVLAFSTARPDGSVSVLGGVCLGLAFTTVLRFVFEFLLFLRTDVYYLVATVCGCVDLHSSSGDLLRNVVRRYLGRPTRPYDPHPNDRRVARWYAPLHVAGYALALVLLAVVVVPVMWRFFSTALSALFGGDVESAHFWDAAILLLLNTAEPLLAGVLKLRDRVQEGRASLFGKR
ncbi:MAG: hypothetical protein ACT4O0_11230 [Pseudonocardia sp.]